MNALNVMMHHQIQPINVYFAMKLVHHVKEVILILVLLAKIQVKLRLMELAVQEIAKLARKKIRHYAFLAKLII